jgi:hypothetical protein
MVHLTEETFSELLDGGRVAGAEDHLADCPVCHGELEGLRRLRSELRELPELEAPPQQWEEIAARLPYGRRPWLRGQLRVAAQVAAMAAVFVIGLGLGSMFRSSEPAGEASLPQVVADQPPASSLPDAMADVQRLSAQYNAALANLERLAQQDGTPVPSLAEHRLASLNALVEASRTALSAEPADPVLNAYLFAALEQREEVLRQMGAQPGTRRPGVMWR